MFKSAFFLIALCCASAQSVHVTRLQESKIHDELRDMLRTADSSAAMNLIVQYKSGPGEHAARVRNLGGRVRMHLGIVNGHAVTIAASAIPELANDPEVEFLTVDHPVQAFLDTGAAAVNAQVAWNSGKIGSGVGVAIVDSGVSNHPDLTSPINRIVYSEDFTGQNVTADQYGHGTHVASIVAGNGTSSSGGQYNKTLMGIAPGVNIINLRALDSAGAGTDSSVIAAIQQAINLKGTYNIRVMNLSLGRAVTGSYLKDPLCQAVEQAWKAGIVVVVSAGNLGRVNNKGIDGYGTITAPGNDPYVITVGAMKTMGTPGRTDDRIASYSSKGPTIFDHIVKPDIVAPGNLVHAASTPDKVSTGLYMTYSTVQFPCSYYMTNCGDGNSQNYMLLNGTSMAAPVVSGAAAILVAASPAMTPDQIKARLMKTAYKSFPASSSVSFGGATHTSYYDMFTVGAGYLDLQAALADSSLASGAATSPTAVYDTSTGYGTLAFAANSALQSYGANVIWGSGELSGSNVIWGSGVNWANNVIWGSSGASAFNVIWGSSTGASSASNVIWGSNTQIAPLISILTNGE